MGPEAGRYSQNANSDHNFGVKAVWDLSELVFHRDELDISAESRNRLRERQFILEKVNQHYFQRLKIRAGIERLRKQQKSSPHLKKPIAEKMFLARVQLGEATAALSALTGGWFQGQVSDEPIE